MAANPDHPKEVYRPLLSFLFQNPSYCKIMAKVSSPADFESLAEFLVFIALPSSKSLRIIQAMTEDEFAQHTKDPTEILRGNSVACKMHTMFVKRVGCEYFKYAVGGEVLKLVKNKGLNCEVDSARLRNAPNILGAVQKGQEALRVTSQTLFERIVSADVLAKMPKEIRAIAALIGFLCDEHKVDKLPVVGGFVWLRYFNPVLVTPDSAGLVPPALLPLTGKQRRNLILATKVLQNLANAVEFGNKEEYMMCMNPTLRENQETMNAYLESVGKDPNCAPDEIPYRSLFMNDDPIDCVTVREKYLLKFHRFCVQYREKITNVLRKSEETSNTDTDTIVLNSEFIALLRDLKEPPSSLGCAEAEEDDYKAKPIAAEAAKGDGEGGCACTIL